MRVWLIKDGEHLPLQRGARPQRVWLLARQLAERGHHVTWWSSNHSHQLKRQLTEGDHQELIEPRFQLKLLEVGGYQRTISWQRLIHHWRLAYRLEKSFPTERPPDIILCCYPIIEVALVAQRYAEPRKIPLILDIRDDWPDVLLRRVPRSTKPLAWLITWPHRLLGASLFRRASALTAISDGLLGWGVKLARRRYEPLDRTFYHGFNRLPQGPLPPQSKLPKLLARLQGKTVFLFAGTFGHSYELDLVLRAAVQLADPQPDIHFVLAGEGATFEHCRARGQTLPNVSLPGWLEQSELTELYRHCQVGILPWGDGLRDAMPNKPFEYMASGLPVLSSCLGEMEELLSRTRAGLHYQPGDLGSLVSAVTRLHQEPEWRQELASRALTLYEENYEASRVYSDFSTHLEEVAHSSTGRPFRGP